MEIYLVGGAVRDMLLGIEAHDKDYAVTGATMEEMLALGYQQVGKSFPVFLHPESKCEYALARTERKSGHGYGGFTFDFSPEVTIEEDLSRRDLTINSMAMAADGRIIDPWGGQEDLRNRILRHTGSAFREDPLRILRTARFAARFAPLGFTVAPETMELMREITDSGELSYLTAERVFKEFDSALGRGDAAVFVRVLRECGALKELFPELDALYGIPARPFWHPEVDTGIHMELCLSWASAHGLSAVEKFALFCHDLGKALTPPEILPRHTGHGERGVTLVNALCERLKVPVHYRQSAVVTAAGHSFVHRCLERTPEEILELFLRSDSFRSPGRLEVLLRCSEADYRGRRGFEDLPYPQPALLRECFAAASAVTARDALAAGFRGKEVTLEQNRQRAAAIARCRREFMEKNRDLLATVRKEP